MKRKTQKKERKDKRQKRRNTYMAATEKNLSLKSFSSQFDENIEMIRKRDRRIQKNHEGKEKKKEASSTSSKTVAAFKRFQMLWCSPHSTPRWSMLERANTERSLEDHEQKRIAYKHLLLFTVHANACIYSIFHIFFIIYNWLIFNNISSIIFLFFILHLFCKKKL